MQKILIYLTLILSLTACAYKIDIQQGNVVTEEQLSRLEIGMDSRQVQQIMGSPMLTDPFHQQRWDYYYSMQQGEKLLERYWATLHFDGEQLARIERNGPIPEKDQPQLNQSGR
ncbi:MAG: outer membrane protein assembly factor BamE [Gammaproteobacteria bacterium]|nr:outer membrane protein assembly factor BamE [Gammaproteobacteria bacterium]MCW8958691.1 outer membrane protein assembly factor BamE [Gammaproteobacteria bacterium]MCW8973572.1 outer membrane protein assembly factor BamE [Gammaproteobacteria bacterium]MCW8993669.1 outer membrane protein assembly factor BamE [Gammaproteobacteria bacterium]